MSENNQNNGSHAQKLYIKVLEAKNLEDGVDASYVSIKFGGKKEKTKTVKQSKNPKWNERFEFPAQTENLQLVFSVRKKIDKKSELLGQVDINLSGGASHVMSAKIDGWWALRPGQSKRKTANGEIRLRLSFRTGEKQSKPKDKAADNLAAATSSQAAREARGQVLKKISFAEQSARDMQMLFSGSNTKHLNKSWEIEGKELQFLEEVGEGTSAKVFKGKYREQDVAIKVLKETMGPKERGDFEKEFELLTSLRSPRVVFFYGVCFAPQTCIILEWCERGSLHDLMKKPDVFDWARALVIAIETVRAIGCLHSWKPQIVHRDLKSQNLLVSANGSIKVCDFGLARATSLNSGMSTLGKLRGTFQYTAPEIYHKQTYTTKADIFSTGIILWELANRVIKGEYEQPFSEYKHLQYDFQVIIQVAKHHLRPTIPTTCPEHLAETVRRCWDADMTVRPTADQLLAALVELQKEYQQNKEKWDGSIVKQ